jgi:hypothetical protein
MTTVRKILDEKAESRVLTIPSWSRKAKKSLGFSQNVITPVRAK